MIGTARPDRTRPARIASPTVASSVTYSSRCAGARCSSTIDATGSPSSGHRVPAWNGCAPAAAIISTVPSGSYRVSATTGRSRSSLTSSTTALNTSDGPAPVAAIVATRRSASCSRTKTFSSSRACAFETAVTTRSVKPMSLASASSGSGWLRVARAISTPQVEPCATIGMPSAESIPSATRRAATSPGTSAYSTIAGRPVRQTSAITPA